MTNALKSIGMESRKPMPTKVALEHSHALNYNANRREGNKKNFTDAWNDSYQYSERLGVSCEKRGTIKDDPLGLVISEERDLGKNEGLFCHSSHFLANRN